MGDPRPFRRLTSPLATGTCRVCGEGLIPVPDAPEPGVHPLCDKTDRLWWSEEERAVWLAERVDRTTTGDTT